MTKGNAVLKVAGILLVLFGVAGILFAMFYGFVGALKFEEMGKDTLTGLLIFYGLFGILTGLFQIATGAVAIRHSNKANHWLRCVIWGIVMLLIGAACVIILYASSGMIHTASEYYPPWYCFAGLIVGCIVLPLSLILGGVLNKISYAKEKALKAKETAAIPDAVGEGVFAGSADELKQESRSSAIGVRLKESGENSAAAIGGRLDYLKKKRLTRIVDPRIERKFGR